MEDDPEITTEEIRELGNNKYGLIMDGPYMRLFVTGCFIVVLIVIAARWSSPFSRLYGGAQTSSTTATRISVHSTAPQADLTSNDDDTAVVVEYTDAGFSPFITEVRVGDDVTFVNHSHGALWVTAKNHPTAKDQEYPEFDSGRSLSRGETFVFTFTKEGAWGFSNLNNQHHLGTIVVTPQ